MTTQETVPESQPYWHPDADRAERAQMRLFFREAASAIPGTPDGEAPYREWHAWSLREPERFWSQVWRWTGVIAERRSDGGAWDSVLIGGDRMAPPDPVLGPRWFAGARLNFAENLLRRRDDAPALIFRDERGRRRSLSFRELHEQSAAVANALRATGVKPGDRVAAFLPNTLETVVGMLGAAWIGAAWSSCSPDFGTRGVLDRFGQIEPVVLIAADGYTYGSRRIDSGARVREIIDELPSVRQVVLIPFLDDEPGLPDGAHDWHAWVDAHTSLPAPAFEQLPFDHPLYVMYSSGTTGLPKCMVHGAGGTLLQHLKEHMLHGDLRADERMFYFTTCGWMMWNWLVSALAVGAPIVLYDGAPIPPDNPAMLWDVADEERVAYFGASARYLALAEKAGLVPAETHDLIALQTVYSTGSPLAPRSFDYISQRVKPGVRVASISGGTDLLSCFIAANPLEPVWRGELQQPGLGMAVDVFDEHGRSIRGAPGELVCTQPFPSMPVGFWNDPDGSKYRDAYFNVFPGVWRHGDWAEFTAHGGMVIYGRSDATLNPGGVRIGTAEIYRQVDQIPEVLESIVIGQEIGDASERDVRIVLFVRLRDEMTLDDALVSRIKQRIRAEASPHHVPKLVLQVHDIPRTLSGKITELAVREAFNGRPVRNTSAMANPEALDEYRKLGSAHAFRAGEPPSVRLPN